MSCERGIIPVLSTKADRFEGTDNRNNLTLRKLAAEYNIPLWDFDLLADTLPGRGLGNDNVHLTSAPLNDYSDPATFEYGYPVNDLPRFMTLDAIRRAVEESFAVNLGLVAIAVFGVAAVVYAALVPGRFRGWFLLLGSIIALYWLQEPLAPRFADFISANAMIGLTVAGWWFSRPEKRALLAPTHASPAEEPLDAETRHRGHVPVRDDWLTLLVIAGTIVALTFFRYVDADFRLTASRPPAPLSVLLMLIQVGLAGDSVGSHSCAVCRSAPS